MTPRHERFNQQWLTTDSVASTSPSNYHAVYAALGSLWVEHFEVWSSMRA